MFYERLKEVCKQRGTTVSKMLTDLNMSTSSTGSWKKGMLPRGEVLKLISKYLNVSVDYLLFGENVYKPINSREITLLEKYNRLSEFNKGKINERIDILLETEK